jgi:hypothetical protein
VSATAADTWAELVTVGLLGTDRRDPPELPDGPIADLVADALRPTPQGRLLASVSATVVARRCGVLPLQPRPPLMPPDADGRPMLPVVAARRWFAVVANWPVLEPEWLAAASAHGWRPSPDVLVAMLRRHQRSPHVAASIVAFGGPVAPWLIEHQPDLVPFTARQDPPAEPRVLPVPAELEPLLGGPPDGIATAVASGLAAGHYKWSHRAVLLNTAARVARASLPAFIAALETGRDRLETHGHESREPGSPLSLWESLIELAAVRRDMLDELEPPN